MHTGQHYDHLMSDLFFTELSIPQPDFNLNVGSGKHGEQTARMLSSIEDVLESVQPDATLIYGDTNSTLAAAIASVKLHIPLVHLEAGLRSFNRLMPEEHNRVLSDHASDLCLAPTELAMDNLRREGLEQSSQLVGDVMIDVLSTVRSLGLAESAGFAGSEYFVATLHRAENTDNPNRLQLLIDSIADAPHPVLLFAHPRLVATAERLGLELTSRSIEVREPLGYPELMATVAGASGVITDSGGLQKEAYFLGVPTTTLRHETEWVETLQGGWNVLANTQQEIAAALNRPKPSTDRGAPFGMGDGASRTVTAILELLNNRE